VRELEEETGLSRGQVLLAQLGAFGRAGRDPRMRVITVAYYALVRPDLVPLVRPGGDASAVIWREVGQARRGRLAFDHKEILDAAIARLQAGIESTDLAAGLVPTTFTIPELRHVHGLVTGSAPDPGNFRRRVQRMLEDHVIEQAPGKRITSSKPALVYRFTGKGR
jgi:8-oxo-dGTP diphosphatase